MSAYTPELGQALFGNPTGEHDVSEIGRAAIQSALHEIERVWSNRNQRAWGYESPTIEGMEVRPYWWGREDAPEAELPNLKWGGVEIRWYKHSMRGLSCDRAMTADDWSRWLDSLMAATRAWDDATEESL